MSDNSAAYLTDLHQRLNRHFSLEEIRTLCLHLNVDHESIPGAEKPSMIRELLLALGRNGRLPQLVTLAQEQRPHVDWPSVPDDFQLPASLASGGTAVPSHQYHYYGDVVEGDKVGGDKIGGDKITVGDISGSSGIAIGRGASANVGTAEGLDENDLNRLFAPLLAAVAEDALPAIVHVRALQAEVGQWETADDEKMADLIGEIAGAAPAAIDHLVDLFAHPALAVVAGGATRYVLKRIQKQS